MLLVGVGLYAFYTLNPLAPELASLVDEKGDRIFPVFIISEMPVGVRGLLIAGILSAAISSLDSILAALAQISVTMFYKPFVRAAILAQRSFKGSAMQLSAKQILPQNVFQPVSELQAFPIVVQAAIW